MIVFAKQTTNPIQSIKIITIQRKTFLVASCVSEHTNQSEIFSNQQTKILILFFFVFERKTQKKRDLQIHESFRKFLQLEQKLNILLPLVLLIDRNLMKLAIIRTKNNFLCRSCVLKQQNQTAYIYVWLYPHV